MHDLIRKFIERDITLDAFALLEQFDKGERLVSMINIKEVRARARHYISDEVAASANMTVEKLQQFVAGTFFPTDEQLAQLKRRMHMDDR